MIEASKGSLEIVWPCDESEGARLRINSDSPKSKIVTLAPPQAAGAVIALGALVYFGFSYLCGAFLVLANFAVCVGFGFYLADSSACKRPS